MTIEFDAIVECWSFQHGQTNWCS